MKSFNIKSVSALALSLAVSTAAFAKFPAYTPDSEDFEVVSNLPLASNAVVPASLQMHLDAQDKAAQAQEEYTNSYQNMIVKNGTEVVKYCGQKAVDTAVGIADFGPVKYAVNMAGAYIMVDNLPVIDTALDILGAASAPIVGPVGPAVATGLKFVNKVADWIPGVHEAKNLLVAAAIKDFAVPSAVGVAKFAYNNAGTVYNGVARGFNYLSNWYNGAPAASN